jgi:hypothetical protein
MTTLLEAYRNLDNSIWDYYEGFRRLPSLYGPFGSNLNSAAAHQQFIRNYYSLSGKELILHQFGYNDMLYDERAFHTNSVFFLGLLIREHTILKTHLLNAKRSRLNYPLFPFLWFLSVLFHDFAMRIEDNSDDYPLLCNLDSLRASYNIEHDILSSPPYGVDADLHNLIAHYFSHRSLEGKVDHGILAGIFLYDRLVKNRRVKSGLIEQKLKWHHSLEKRYAQAAAAIACHNMWTIPSDHSDIQKYIERGLSYLIQPNFKEISLKNFPLLFLFGIVDTIDPVKLYMRDGLNVEQILSNVTISFTKRAIRLANVKGSSLDFSKLIQKGYDLKGWMAVEVQNGSDWLTISFKR